MVKGKIKLILTFCLLSILSVFIYSNKTLYIDAETITPPNVISAEESGDEDLGLEGEEEGSEEEFDYVFEGFLVTESVISDANLYSALLEVYSAYYESLNGVKFKGTKIYSDMFKDFEVIELDNCNISSLEGMDRLELDNLKIFSANSNAITVFKSDYLKQTENWVFTELSLADNKINSVDFKGLISLSDIDLSSNQLTKVDLSMIEGKSAGSPVSINIANNQIVSMEDIKLPSIRISHYNINILNNRLSNVSETYFSDKYTVNVGIQGFVWKEDLLPITDTGNKLVYYKTNIEGLSVDVYKADGELLEFVQNISDSDLVENCLKINLSVGKYRFVYKLNGVDAYSREYTNKLYLKYCEFNVIPQNLNCVFVHKNKEYKELGKVTGKVTVELSSDDVGAKIYYQINNGEWVEGTTIVCDEGGNYSIKVKSVVDGVESFEQSIWVRTSLNLYIPDALMLILVLLLALVLFLIVLPIVSKKYFKKD